MSLCERISRGLAIDTRTRDSKVLGSIPGVARPVVESLVGAQFHTDRFVVQGTDIPLELILLSVNYLHELFGSYQSDKKPIGETFFMGP